jgi:Cft2 family RNA processing exonuclease
MKITFLGGADEVGASSTLIEIGGKRLLVDAGIRPSPKARWGLAGDQLPDLSQIDALGNLDAILVTHAHTDHTGALELVVAHQPEAPVYATPPTISLTRVLHQDARRIMQSRLDEEGELPLFDDVAVGQLMAAFVPVPFQAPLALGEGLSVTWFPAGHIAGAAMLGLESDEGNLLITGDISISPQRTVDGARPPAFRPDWLILESTYGGRMHANRAVQERKLIETAAQVASEGGKVLIPAFALGRAQELLLILAEFQRRGEMPPIPVWADGMVRAVCQAYVGFSDYLPLPLQERGAKFFEGAIRPVQNNGQRNALVWEPGPAVIVASSGMLAGGPSLSYARALAGGPQHAILLTGYQDEESPGRRLQEAAERGRGSIRLGKDRVDVRCRLATYSLSAHADEGQIVSLAETLDPEQIFLVHGDEAARLSLKTALGQRGRVVHLPRAGQSFEFASAAARLHKSARPNEFRARQSEIARQRRAAMPGFEQARGKWLLLRGEQAVSVRCLDLAADHLWVEVAPGLEQSIYPEEVLAILGEAAPTAADLAPYRRSAPAPAVMEPNQALAEANRAFPLAARLRKTGYRLDLHVLTLTFDFPDIARARFAPEIAALQAATGWEIEIAPEANQLALGVLVRELLPAGAAVGKGPAIHRQEKRVAVILAPSSPEQRQALAADRARLSEQFRALSGYGLEIKLAEAPAPTPVPTPGPAANRWEINAAYAAIRAALEGSSLYRTSLKDGEIMLSFISRRVGERYQETIAALEQEIGWPLRINPQPNQGAIGEAALALLAGAGWAAAKGPSIYPDRGEASVVLTQAADEAAMMELVAAFEQQTGFRLILSSTAPAPSPAANPDVVMIPLARIRLRPHQKSLTLDAEKVNKAIERARRLGISPPIQLTRLGDGYLLDDGLYRLAAARALGMEMAPAVVG